MVVMRVAFVRQHPFSVRMSCIPATNLAGAKFTCRRNVRRQRLLDERGSWNLKGLAFQYPEGVITPLKVSATRHISLQAARNWCSRRVTQGTLINIAPRTGLYIDCTDITVTRLVQVLSQAGIWVIEAGWGPVARQCDIQAGLTVDTLPLLCLPKASPWGRGRSSRIFRTAPRGVTWIQWAECNLVVNGPHRSLTAEASLADWLLSDPWTSPAAKDLGEGFLAGSGPAICELIRQCAKTRHLKLPASRDLYLETTDGYTRLVQSMCQLKATGR